MEIKGREDFNDMTKFINRLKTIYVGRKFRHINGTIYQVKDVCVISIDGKGYYGFVYHAIGNEINFTRPMHEFIDGRFTEVLEE